jgi:galactose mutarotase-like enzyme
MRHATTATATIRAVLRLAAGRWELAVIPERGGRVASLRLDGEELLDQGIGVDQPTAKGFVEGGAWGWDEMVPNLEPTDTLPDHGEAWRLPWEIVARSADSIGMSCTGRLVPWRLGRRIFLGQRVEVFYRYTNAGDEPHHAYWCAHPLFKYEPGMEIGARVSDELAEGSSVKTFLPEGAVDHVTLGWRSGKRIDVSWDAFLTPRVAIWMCNGDLGGYRQVAVEPATAAPMLAPGTSMTWWLQIRPL